jgi:ubiquinone/menaquinone biosynthesis C-methylase UbiE
MPVLHNFRSRPDPVRAVSNYRQLAAGYDASCTRIDALRQRALRALGLRRGETVFDIACGTGSTLPLLAALVGPTGHVIGVELSPEMAELARRRVALNCDPSCRVDVVECPVEAFTPEEPADALLLSYTHDVLQSPAALDRLMAIAKPGARVVVLGMKTLPWLWGWPVNAFNLARAHRCLTTFAHLDCPWRLLAGRGVTLRQECSTLWGSAYIAVGRFNADARPPPPPALAPGAGASPTRPERIPT